MQFHYYPETDSLYIDLADASSVDSLEVVSGIVLDFGADGALVGIEADHVGLVAYPMVIEEALRNLPEGLSLDERQEVQSAFEQILAGQYKQLDPSRQV